MAHSSDFNSNCNPQIIILVRDWLIDQIIYRFIGGLAHESAVLINRGTTSLIAL